MKGNTRSIRKLESSMFQYMEQFDTISNPTLEYRVARNSGMVIRSYL